MPLGAWLSSHQTSTYGGRCRDGDDEQTRSGLRDKVCGVHDERSKSIILVCQCLADRIEVLAAMRCESAADVFQDKNPRSAAVTVQCLKQIPERPKDAGSTALEASAPAGQR